MYLAMREDEKDNINPDHYKISDGVQCIDFIEASMTKDEFRGYLRGNILKYIFRCYKKNGIEDIRKSEWFIKKLIETHET